VAWDNVVDSVIAHFGADCGNKDAWFTCNEYGIWNSLFSDVMVTPNKAVDRGDSFSKACA
jgi:hypothetical protein